MNQDTKQELITASEEALLEGFRWTSKKLSSQVNMSKEEAFMIERILMIASGYVTRVHFEDAM